MRSYLGLIALFMVAVMPHNISGVLLRDLEAVDEPSDPSGVFVYPTKNPVKNVGVFVYPTDDVKNPVGVFVYPTSGKEYPSGVFVYPTLDEKAPYGVFVYPTKQKPIAKRGHHRHQDQQEYYLYRP